MTEIAYTLGMKFRDYLWDKYLEFSKPTGRMRAKSQAEFARYLEISPVNLSRYLNGDQEPEFQTVVKLAVKLGQEIYSITGFNPPEQTSLSDWFSNLPDDRWYRK